MAGVHVQRRTDDDSVQFSPTQPSMPTTDRLVNQLPCRLTTAYPEFLLFLCVGSSGTGIHTFLPTTAWFPDALFCPFPTFPFPFCPESNRTYAGPLRRTRIGLPIYVHYYQHEKVSRRLFSGEIIHKSNKF